MRRPFEGGDRVTQPGSSRLAPSTRLGPYEILAAVGAGGMGEVYRAKDTRLDRDVAIKVLPPHLAGDESCARVSSARRRPSRRSTTRTSARSTTSATRRSGTTTLHYLVMELLEGESLADRLAKGPLPLDEVLRSAIQIASALDAAHQQGIVHRDLKPGNMMLTKSGVKLLDFGLREAGERGAAAGEVLSTPATPLDKPLTRAGHDPRHVPVHGAGAARGAGADARTDIFAFGAVLYEMATGRRAFEGKSRTSLIAAIMSSQPPPISSVRR